MHAETRGATGSAIPRPAPAWTTKGGDRPASSRAVECGAASDAPDRLPMTPHEVACSERTMSPTSRRRNGRPHHGPPVRCEGFRPRVAFEAAQGARWRGRLIRPEVLAGPFRFRVGYQLARPDLMTTRVAHDLVHGAAVVARRHSREFSVSVATASRRQPVTGVGLAKVGVVGRSGRHDRPPGIEDRDRARLAR